jgi:hypothetical protein
MVLYDNRVEVTNRAKTVWISYFELVWSAGQVHVVCTEVAPKYIASVRWLQHLATFEHTVDSAIRGFHIFFIGYQ